MGSISASSSTTRAATFGGSSASNSLRPGERASMATFSDWPVGAGGKRAATRFPVTEPGTISHLGVGIRVRRQSSERRTSDIPSSGATALIGRCQTKLKSSSRVTLRLFVFTLTILLQTVVGRVKVVAAGCFGGESHVAAATASASLMRVRGHRLLSLQEVKCRFGRGAPSRPRPLARTFADRPFRIATLCLASPQTR